MRKWRIWTLALALVAGVGLLGTSLWVSAQGTPVTYENELIQGTAEAFDGVIVHQNYGLFYTFGASRSGWRVDYPIGQGGAANTQWYHRMFLKKGTSEEMPLWPFISSELTYGITPDQRYGEEDQAALDRLRESVLQRIPDDADQYTETVLAADWLERFPVYVGFGSGGTLTWGIDPAHEEALQAWFSIPVPEDLLLTVTAAQYVQSDKPYTCVRYADVGPTFESHAVQYQNDALFTVDLTNPDGSALDVSRIPGGTGIYRMTEAEPYLETVFPFPAETRVHALELLPDGERIAMISEQNGEGSLTILSAETFEVLQTVPFPVTPGDASWVTIRQSEELLVRTGGRQLLLFTPGAEGQYAAAANADSTDDPAVGLLGTDSTVFGYDGSRLVLAAPYGEDSVGLDLAVSVYDPDGARSTMICRCSLSPENRYTQPIYQGHPDALQIRFE